MPDLRSLAEGFGALMKVIRPYAGDLAIGAALAFLVRQIPVWIGGEPTSTTWTIVAGAAMMLVSYSSDWYDPEKGWQIG